MSERNGTIRQQVYGKGDKIADVLWAMITNTHALSRIARNWDGKNFADRESNVIGDLAVRYWKRHGKAPRQAMRSLFSSWAGRQRGDTDVANARLGSLLESQNGSKLSTDHAVDLASELFNAVAVERTLENARGHLDLGETDQAAESLSRHARVDFATGKGTELFLDHDRVRSYFAKEHESIVRYDQGLGKFFANVLRRSAFVAFMGMNKAGKSFWIQDVGYRAAIQRLKVMYVVCGDMPEEEIGQRFLSRTATWPLDSPTGEWPCVLRIPTGIKKPVDEKPYQLAVAQYEEEEFAKPLGPERAVKSIERVQNKMIKSLESYLHLEAYGSGGISVPEIRARMEDLIHDGWGHPDVLCVDYADVLKPIDRKMDKRDQINESWAALRGLAMGMHCLVVTGSQADTGSFNSWMLTRENFTEDRRKLDHVTAMVGINMTDDEKERGLCRLNYINRRRGVWRTNRFCWCAGNLGVSNPGMVSAY